MLFNSTEFVLLVCLTFVPYYLLPSKRFQVEILILASLVFYAYSNIWLLILLVFSAYINAFSSLKISNHVELKIKRFWAIAGVITNLSILGFFKYAGLISFTILGNTGSHGEFAHYIALIPLPVGISFYTFQGISLLMDTWSGNVQSDREQSQLRHFKHITFYICFFPQLVAGPIVKSHEFLPQIKDKRISQINWERCFKNLLTGYFLKIFVADNLKELTAWIEFPYFLGKSSVELTFMLFAFSMQIFADFAGYSLIAIGIAGLFGYKLPTNFNFPYISRSFSEFWRRWHISLSTWLRDYLYYPLGGNRRGRLRTYFNLFIVM